MIDPAKPWQVRALADAAQAQGDLAMSRQGGPDSYIDPAIIEEVYAAGVEDVLRFLVGDAAPTERLRPIHQRYLRTIKQDAQGGGDA